VSINHRIEEEELASKSLAETYRFLGEGDTPQLYQLGFKLNVDYDIATSAANSIDRKTVYVDRTLYEWIMDGECKVNNLRPRDIITAWMIHEHVEKCIVDGDNPIDQYAPAHQCALAKEHQFIKYLGASVSKYEEAIWPAVVACYKNEDIKKVPKDLWVAPLLDDPSKRDEEILKRYAKMGVKDALKYPKAEVNYGITNHQCKDCSMWQPDKLSQMDRKIALCSAVGGLVRSERGCSLWRPKGK